MLKYALKLVNDAGYKVNNVTVMITAGQPRISPHINDMKKNISIILDIDTSCVGIGATTGEKLSACGQGKGINVVAMVSLKSANAE